MRIFKSSLSVHFKKIRACQQGVAYIEFALCIGVLIFMFLGAVEISRYVLIIQKVEKTASSLADIVAQTNPGTGAGNGINSGDMAQLMNDAVPNLMSPYGFSTNGYAIISDIYQPDNAHPAVVSWQYCGGGTAKQTSHLGTQGNNAVVSSFPAGFAMNPTATQADEVITAEVFYLFTPMVNQSIIQNALIYRLSIFVPRLGLLNTPSDALSIYLASCS